MAFQFATDVRNGRLDAIETVIGTLAKLVIYSGSEPANCAADTTGTLLVEYDLASDWAAAASGGQKALNNLPLSVTATAGAPTNAGYFRIFTSAQTITPGAGTPCEIQGNVTVTGGGGDLTLDNISIATGQTVNITGFTITDGNA